MRGDGARLVVGCLAMVLACGDDRSSSGSHDAAVPLPDAQVHDATPPADAETADATPPDAGTDDASVGPCNPVTQQGCAGGEKCSWLVIDVDPFLGRTDCVPDGTVEIGGACTDGAPGETTGFDDCAAGGLCVAGTCHAICTIDPDSCGEGFACARYSRTFTDDPAANTGVCDEVCDPVAQDCSDLAEGCYLSLWNGRGTCAIVAGGAENPPAQGEDCVNEGNVCFLNGCARGYGAFLYGGPGSPRDCTAFCAPVDTYLVDPDGDGAGERVAGADANGAAPADCSEARIGVPAHQCRFFQSFFRDMNGQYIDYVPDAYGLCAPRGATYGNCNRFSHEWFFETYNDFIEGGGTPETWGEEIAARCAAEPYRCAFGCVRVATLEALEAAYCAVPENTTRPSCIDGLRGARIVRRSLERYWAEQRIRARAAVTD